MAQSANASLDAALEQHRVKALPPSMDYIPDFITKEEEADILDQIPENKWISLSHRRLQTHPAPLTASNRLVSTTGLPKWLTKPIVERLEDLRIFKDSPHREPNHCLINEYLPGQGIMPHEDGAAYHPIVATVSLSGTLVLDVYEKATRERPTRNKGGESQQRRWRILQEPRSLLLTTGSAYTDTLHGIAEVEQDVDLSESDVANWSLLGEERQAIINAGGKNERTTRISLTFRDVLKLSNLGTFVFGKPKG